ncbi:hypothetical protein EV191_1011407 [Tamaricihabitans halophyticus]|uniref:Outer membrane channel protein CpnT-like N-terminal domain-containing protein n=1 Tax=Tamaricihabitans halophyticus TaxID=1262583 RepID=A0A4R2R3P1_9PSEU|nr:hypothetical protein [Tamaricihabitans halophyticus]TCP57452.1 hypothetical protein EV191_1011407 [Tamaricihabitans halophyticus]
MGENFHAEPEHIAGYGVLVGDVSGQLSTIQTYVGEHASAKSGFDGLIMSALKPLVDTYASETAKRILGHGNNLHDTSEELTRAAWDYSGADKSNYQIFADDGMSNPNVPPRVEGYKDFPGPAPYPPASDPAADLKPPDIAEADIKSMVDEVGGSLKAIDWVVSTVTGWSPVEAITEPISGNWNALTGAGDALKSAGTALEESLDNLTKALSGLDSHWNGGAAQEFNTYITTMVNGAGQEGPLNRLVGGVYGLVAQQIEKAAQYVVSTLKSVVDQIGQRVATSWIPGYGQYKLIQFIKNVVDIFIEAKALVDEVNAMVDQVKGLLEMAQDPVGAIQGKIEEKIKPIEEKIDQYQRGAEVAKDIADVSDTEAWEDTPDSTYSTEPDGADPERAGA